MAIDLKKIFGATVGDWVHTSLPSGTSLINYQGDSSKTVTPDSGNEFTIADDVFRAFAWTGSAGAGQTIPFSEAGLGANKTFDLYLITWVNSGFGVTHSADVFVNSVKVGSYIYNSPGTGKITKFANVQTNSSGELNASLVCTAGYVVSSAYRIKEVVETVPPSGSITSTFSGNQSGTKTVNFTASDNAGLASAQLKVDGANYGSPVTISGTGASGSVFLDTTTLTNGIHNLTLLITDAAGNAFTTTAVSIAVLNLQTLLLPYEGLELYLEPHRENPTNGAAANSPHDYSLKNRTVTGTGWTYQTNLVNGKAILRASGSQARYVCNDTIEVRCGFIVAKFDANPFTAIQGLLTGLTDNPILVSKSTGTEFQDFNYDYYEYRLNDRIYSENDSGDLHAPAPTGSFKLIFFRFWANIVLNGISIGQDRADASKKFDGDIALLALLSSDFCEKRIRKYSQGIATYFGLLLADVIPFQGSKSDKVAGARAINIYDPPEGVRIAEVLGDVKRQYDLSFENRTNTEFKQFRAYHNNHYPEKPCIFRDYNVIPPEDGEGYFDSQWQKTGANNDISYSVSFKEK